MFEDKIIDLEKKTVKKRNRSSLLKRQFFKLLFWRYPVRILLGTTTEVPLGSSQLLHANAEVINTSLPST
jgi:hypothetical protein